jgi:hypothetical protein
MNVSEVYVSKQITEILKECMETQKRYLKAMQKTKDCVCLEDKHFHYQIEFLYFQSTYTHVVWTQGGWFINMKGYTYNTLRNE